ncbi:MAG: hypothetical protein U1F26_00370 [Lysobacterales bacterium]
MNAIVDRLGAGMREGGVAKKIELAVAIMLLLVAVAQCTVMNSQTEQMALQKDVMKAQVDVAELQNDIVAKQNAIGKDQRHEAEVSRRQEILTSTLPKIAELLIQKAGSKDVYDPVIGALAANLSAGLGVYEDVSDIPRAQHLQGKSPERARALSVLIDMEFPFATYKLNMKNAYCTDDASGLDPPGDRLLAMGQLELNGADLRKCAINGLDLSQSTVKTSLLPNSLNGASNKIFNLDASLNESGLRHADLNGSSVEGLNEEAIRRGSASAGVSTFFYTSDKNGVLAPRVDIRSAAETSEFWSTIKASMDPAVCDQDTTIDSLRHVFQRAPDARRFALYLHGTRSVEVCVRARLEIADGEVDLYGVSIPGGKFSGVELRRVDFRHSILGTESVPLSFPDSTLPDIKEFAGAAIKNLNLVGALYPLDDFPRLRTYFKEKCGIDVEQASLTGRTDLVVVKSGLIVNCILPSDSASLSEN